MYPNLYPKDPPAVSRPSRCAAAKGHGKGRPERTQQLLHG
jgi:hypothetical protein